jgi:hypothetical protein
MNKIKNDIKSNKDFTVERLVKLIDSAKVVFDKISKEKAFKKHLGLHVFKSILKNIGKNISSNANNQETHRIIDSTVYFLAYSLQFVKHSLNLFASKDFKLKKKEKVSKESISESVEIYEEDLVYFKTEAEIDGELKLPERVSAEDLKKLPQSSLVARKTELESLRDSYKTLVSKVKSFMEKGYLKKSEKIAEKIVKNKAKIAEKEAKIPKSKKKKSKTTSEIKKLNTLNEGFRIEILKLGYLSSVSPSIEAKCTGRYKRAKKLLKTVSPLVDSSATATTGNQSNKESAKSPGIPLLWFTAIELIFIGFLIAIYLLKNSE